MIFAASKSFLLHYDDIISKYNNKNKVIVFMKDKNPYLKSYKLNSIFMVIKSIKTRF